MINLQKELDYKKEINIKEDNNKYIDLLNKYQEYFDFKEYDIIPNSYGKFLNINDLEDYNDIPDDILSGIKKIFNKDLKEKSIYKGLTINGIKKITMHEIGEIIEKCFEKKKSEDVAFSENYYNYVDNFNYRYTYDLCKIIIKYIPLKGQKKEYQTRLYNLYKLFDKYAGQPIEIDSYENLYTDVNKGIIQYINEHINNCSNVEETKKYTDDFFKLINEYSDLLDPHEYKIIPNQMGELKKLDDLYKDNNIFEELKDILSKYSNIRESLMDLRITKFNPSEIMNNEDLKNEINYFIENNKFDIRKTLQLIPKKDDKNKQKDIKYIYDNLCNNGKKFKEIEIDLELSFWEETNKSALKKIKSFFKKNKTLIDIAEEEDKALHILETLYKYIPPELKENQKLQIVPNQYGMLYGYEELSEEKELNQNFKEMLKKLFNYDISCYLKHKKLNYYISKQLSINDEIIQIINDGFSDHSRNLDEKAKEFIKFYPKNTDDNYVLKFIDCYKALAREKFKEEEISTINNNIWDKAIKILLNKLLKKIKDDENIDKTSSRIGLDVNNTIDKLNKFYSIVFKFDISTKTRDVSFIPNEKGIYKKLKEVYINSDIDDEIKEVLTLLNEKKSFDNILIHHKVELNISHSQKKLEDIATIIDKEIKKYYTNIDLLLQTKDETFKIDENAQKACKLLIQKWFKEHKDKHNLFEFTKSHLVDISVKILFDEKTKNILDDLLINDYEGFIEIIKFQDPNAPLLWLDESFIEEEESSDLSISSFDATLDNTVNQGYQNNFNFINFNNNNNNNYNNYQRYLYRHYYRNNRHNNYYRELIRNRYNEGMHKYCLAQAYVYEKLLDSHLFSEINWKNKISENEEGELVILENSHRYNVKKSYSNYDFTVKTNQNKEYKISVKRECNSKNSDLKYKFSYSQWTSFNGELKSVVLAFVSLKYLNDPDIYFTKNISLAEL